MRAKRPKPPLLRSPDLGEPANAEQFADLIERGCAKVNISTALKRRFMQSNLAFLHEAEAADSWDPPSLFAAVRNDVIGMTAGLMKLFGSAGKAT